MTFVDCGRSAAVELLHAEVCWISRERWLSSSFRLVSLFQDESGEIEAGFLSSGLFRYSRHPNFFAEFSIWWVIYAFTSASFSAPISFDLSLVVPTETPINWTIMGAFLLQLLFAGSTHMTELVSAGKVFSFCVGARDLWLSILCTPSIKKVSPCGYHCPPTSIFGII